MMKVLCERLLYSAGVSILTNIKVNSIDREEQHSLYLFSSVNFTAFNFFDPFGGIYQQIVCSCAAMFSRANSEMKSIAWLKATIRMWACPLQFIKDRSL
jgi:hypothetical protein